MKTREILWIVVGMPILFFIIFFLIDVGVAMFKRLDRFLEVVSGGEE